MKRIYTKTLAFVLIALILSVSSALNLSEALSAANNRTDVINAQLDLNDANIALARTQSDPLALRLDKVQARQRARRKPLPHPEHRRQRRRDRQPERRPCRDLHRGPDVRGGARCRR